MWTSSGRNWGWCIIGFTTLFYFQAGENSQGLSFWQIQALIGLFFAIHLATYFFLVTWGTWIVLDQTSGKGPEIQVLCGCLVLFIHCWVEYACSTHPCSGSNCLTGSPSLIIKVCTTAPHKGPVPNQTYGGLNPMVIPINSYSHRKLIGHRNFAINFGRFFPVPQWFFQWPSGHRSFQTPGVPIASVLSTNLGWGFMLCYVLSYMLVSMGPSVFSEEFRAAGSWWDWDGLGIEKWDFNGISYGVYHPCVSPSYQVILRRRVENRRNLPMMTIQVGGFVFFFRADWSCDQNDSDEVHGFFDAVVFLYLRLEAAWDMSGTVGPTGCADRWRRLFSIR